MISKIQHLGSLTIIFAQFITRLLQAKNNSRSILTVRSTSRKRGIGLQSTVLRVRDFTVSLLSNFGQLKFIPKSQVCCFEVTVLQAANQRVRIYQWGKTLLATFISSFLKIMASTIHLANRTRYFPGYPLCALAWWTRKSRISSLHG